MELGAETTQGLIQLGSEDEHCQTGLQPKAAAHEANADRDGDESDAERGRQLEHRPREEADAERPHRRPPVPLAHVGDRRRLGAPRLKARSVGSPRTTSRKCVDSNRSACQRSRVRSSV